MGKTARVNPNKDVVAQRMGSECVLVHMQTNRVFELNRTAARFWELLSAGLDLDEIRKKMLEEFNVDADRLEKEMEGILSSMVKENLVTVSKEPSTRRSTGSW